MNYWLIWSFHQESFEQFQRSGLQTIFVMDNEAWCLRKLQNDKTQYKAENPLMRNGVCVSVYVKPIRYPYAFYVAPLTRIFTHVKKFPQ